MQYTVVHSADPYLLARLATDLQMEGLKSDMPWNVTMNCFVEKSNMWLAINHPENKRKNLLTFFNHPCICQPDMRLSLTEANYIKVLTQILQP